MAGVEEWRAAETPFSNGIAALRASKCWRSIGSMRTDQRVIKIISDVFIIPRTYVELFCLALKYQFSQTIR